MRVFEGLIPECGKTRLPSLPGLFCLYSYYSGWSEIASQLFPEKDDTISVGAFSTGIDLRDGKECIVDGCGYNLMKCLDRCHIIGRTEDEEVCSICSPCSVCLIDSF